MYPRAQAKEKEQERKKICKMICPCGMRAKGKEKKTHLSQQVGKSNVDVGGIQGRGLDEHESVLLCKALGLLCVDGAQVSQIRLVTDEHDNDVGVGVLAHLAQPARDALVGAMLGDVVQQQCAHSTAVVGRSDGPVAFLSSSVPNLGLMNMEVGKKRVNTLCPSKWSLGVLHLLLDKLFCLLS